MVRRGLLNGSKQTKTVKLQIWGLFVAMMENPTKNIEYIWEIFESAKAGRINLDRPFNLAKYDAIIRRNGKLNTYRDMKEFGLKYIDFSRESLDRQDSKANGGITVDVVSYQASVISDTVDDFEKLFIDDELKDAVGYVNALNESFIVDEGIDVIFLLKKALDGIPDAVAKLRTLCEDFPLIGENIKIIISSGQEVATLFK